MGISNQPDYPPLLRPGFHEMTLDELREKCVTPFRTSTTRTRILAGLEHVLAELRRVGIRADLWVNGSFLTLKNDPNDSDVLLCLDSSFLPTCSDPQKQILSWIVGNLKSSHLCDSYVLWRYPSSDPNHWIGEYMYAYWLRQFGFSRETGGRANLKGIALIKVNS